MKSKSSRPIILALVTFLVQTPLTATTFYILTFSDGIAVDGSCTLREAIVAARTDQPVDACAAGGAEDEIVLANTGTYSFGLGHESLLDPSTRLRIRGGIPELSELYVIGMESANRFLQIDGGASVELRDLVLENGSALTGENGAGGALYVGDAALSVANVTVRTSEASMGGGLAFTGLGEGSLDLRNVRFLNNSAILVAAEPSYTWGGGLLISRMDTFSTVLLRDVLFQGNRVQVTAPQPYALAGGMFLGLRNEGLALLERVRFVGNGIEIGPEWGTVEGVGISIWLDDYEGIDQMPEIRMSDIQIEGSYIQGPVETALGIAMNVEVQNGPSIQVDRLEARDHGVTPGAELRINSFGGEVELKNTLLVGSSARGLEVREWGYGSVRIGHLTTTGHSTEEMSLVEEGTGSIRLENSILWGDGTADLTTIGNVDLATENLIGSNPLFVDAGAGDFELLPTSAAVGSGNSTFPTVGIYDVRHRPRIVGGNTDLGALELGGLFGDGFESSDSGSWSLVEP